MKTLFTTDYKNYEPEWPRSARPSARAIILIDDISDYSSLAPHDRLALAYAKNLGYYKFPGGGIGEGEEKTAALIREVEEETGLIVRLTDRIFTLDERYGAWRYVSDYFTCEIVDVGKPSLTEEEKELETESKWLALDDALDIFSTWQNYDPGTSRHGLYLREFTALEEYKSGKQII